VTKSMTDIQESTAYPTLAYTTEIDHVTEHEWNSILQRFDDANLIQTWSYGAVRWGASNLSHVVLKRDGEIVAAAQVIITKVPVMGAGLAYIKMGPVWRLRNTARELATLRHMLSALRQIYAVRRGLLLKVSPPGTEDGTGDIRALFSQEGFTRDLSIGIPRTAFIDLSHSMDDLRSSLKPTWRRNLVLAERNDLRIVEAASDELFDVFVALYKQMLKRKSITGTVDIHHFQQIQKQLPEALKMRVLICEHQGEPVAGLVVPLLGQTAPNLLAATGDRGLELRASYLLHWRMLAWLKKQDYRWYDLDALNHETYPGISQFKLGFAGRLGWEAEYLGRFAYCTNTVSRLSVAIGERLKNTYRALEVAVHL
jgi:lipid II:glycine glycyltransferase (peptidoglycan interpeptide bridge formation enzyme)